ncbi:helix-turn-helix transcriptional regulator [Providencia rettgeri]
MNQKLSNHNFDDNLISMMFGKAIRRIRIEKGLTGHQLAMLLKISQQQISRYERGSNKLTVDMIIKLAFVLNVSLEVVYRYFFEELVSHDIEDIPLFTEGIISKKYEPLN